MKQLYYVGMIGGNRSHKTTLAKMIPKILMEEALPSGGYTVEGYAGGKKFQVKSIRIGFGDWVRECMEGFLPRDVAREQGDKKELIRGVFIQSIAALRHRDGNSLVLPFLSRVEHWFLKDVQDENDIGVVVVDDVYHYNHAALMDLLIWVGDEPQIDGESSEFEREIFQLYSEKFLEIPLGELRMKNGQFLLHLGRAFPRNADFSTSKEYQEAFLGQNKKLGKIILKLATSKPTNWVG